MSIHSRLLIRDYDNIRHILRDVYIFGCYTREDFQRKGVGSRKLDNEQYRIREYLPKSFLQERRGTNRKKIQYCSYHMLDGTENCIADTYRNKSFTELDVLSYFRILRCLGGCDALSLMEMACRIPDSPGEITFDKDTLYPKVEELVEKGLVERQVSEEGVRYKLSPDIWEDYTDQELLDIYYLLDFARNTSPIEVPYYLLQRKLRLYLYSHRNRRIEDRQILCFKHNHLVNALDNEVMLTCLRGIHDYQILGISHGNGREDSESLAVPLKIIQDALYGRQSLLCYDRCRDAISVIRLDRIRKVEILGEWSKEDEDWAEDWKKLTDLCWCTASPEEEPVRVGVEFFFDEEKEAFILQRLQKEGHGGRIQRMAPNEYHYEILVRDPVEMIPWIRSFGERARVLPGPGHTIDQRIHQDWRRAIEKYADI